MSDFLASETEKSEGDCEDWSHEDAGSKRRAQLSLRAGRIIQLVQLIYSRPRYWNRQMLANSLGVSERQITKDLELLREDLTFQIKREPRGGYYFTSIPQLPAVSYSLPQAMALVLAAEATRQLAGFPTEQLDMAMSQLSSIMPDELRPLLERRFRPAGDPNPHREKMIRLFTEAIARQRSVNIVYRAASHDGEAQQRRVDPYEIVSYGYSFHLLGWCHLRQEIRDFKLDRIERALVTQERFDRDPAFDLDTFFAQGWGMMRGTGAEPEGVELIFSTKAARWVAEERWHAEQVCEWLPDGRLGFRVTVPVTDELRRWVLRYGTDCQVVQPASLRDWVLDQARGLIQAYAE